jgi:dTDP-4-amino-4,6-dideoxygalactose transaminase
MSSSQPFIGVGTLKVSARATELVLEALANNRLSYGPLMQRFEREFASLHGCRFGVMTNSGTSALQVALQAMKELHGWNDGDEVIVPSVTFVATANIVLHNRMQPVLADVDPIYYHLDPRAVEAALTPRTRAIIPVHLFGQPADMDDLVTLAARHGLKLIEDSAETMFARYRERPVGSLGEIGCFSTYAAHLLVTGVGGLCVTNDPEYAVRTRSLVNHGRDSIYISIDDDKGKTVEELRTIVARRFNFVSVGHSFRATELEAALGLAQLEEWPAMIAARRANARALTTKLGEFEEHLQLPSLRPGCEHSFMMFPIVLRDESKADLVNFLEENGVETRDMLPLTNQPVYQRLLGWREEDYPVARWINRNGFYLGCHQDLHEDALDYMASLFGRFYRRRTSPNPVGACLVLTDCTAAGLEQSLDVIPRDLFDRVLALDDGLPEDARSALEREAIEIVSLAGKDAIERVLSEDLALREENLVFFPANGRGNPRDVGRLLLALERGNDMAVASRFVVGGERRGVDRIRSYRSIGNRVFSLLVNLVFFGNLTDSLSRFRAVRLSRLSELRLSGKGLPLHYQLSILATERRWRVAEIPTTEMLAPDAEPLSATLRSIPSLLWVLFREGARGARRSSVADAAGSRKIEPGSTSQGRR